MEREEGGVGGSAEGCEGVGELGGGGRERGGLREEGREGKSR